MTITSENRSAGHYQSLYSNAVKSHGRDSEQAKAAGREFWTVRTCALLTDMLEQHDLTPQQRKRIMAVVRTAGRRD